MDYVYDIELYQNFFCVNFLGFPDREERVSFEISSRRDQRKEMLEFLAQDGLRLIGFNNCSYDYYVLHMIIENPEISLMVLWKRVQRDIFTSRENQKIIWDSQRHVFQIDLFKINHYDNIARSSSLKWLEFTKRWYKVQDLPIKPDQTIELNQMDDMIRYCWNDVEFTFELAEDCWGAVTFRENMTKILGRNVMDYSDVQLGQYLNQKKYQELTGKKWHEIKKGRTFRRDYAFSDIIGDVIEFQTPVMKEWFEKIKKRTFIDDKKDVVKYDIIISPKGVIEEVRERTIKDTISKLKKEYEVEWLKHNTIITFAKGGLHTVDMPRVVNRKEGWTLKEKDVASMYPRGIVVDGVYPEHLGEAWNQSISDSYDYRMEELKPMLKTLEYKSHEWNEINDEQEVYKLAMNGGGFGKLGSAYSWQYDPLAKYKVTINCQLKLLMLIEDFCVAGIKIISVNTDGVVIHYPKTMQSVVDRIHNEWEEKTSFLLEDTHYNKLVFASVNDYIAVIVDPETDEVDKVKYKGDFEVNKDPHKNNSQRIVAIAMSEYFTKDVALTDIIGHLGYKFTNEGKEDLVTIYDYCIGKKKTSSCEYWFVNKGKADMLRDKVIRYYVAKTPDYLLKKYTKGKREGSYEKINVGFNARLFMEYYPAANVGGSYKIDKTYYMNECRKVIKQIESGTRIIEGGAFVQGKLF